MSTKDEVESKIWTKLDKVMDPELYISVTDLGLIYDLKIDKGVAKINMTLTTMGCPLFSVLEADIKGKVGSVAGVKDVDVQLVFDPPWTLERMSEKAKAQLGI